MCVQLATGLQALHEWAGCSHMDIKLENILVSDVGSLKFCDFGFSTPVNKVVK